MATIGTTAVTLLDFMRRQDTNGKIATLIELLAETNEILHDMLWIEGNLPTGHKTSVRTGLPTVAWRMLNYGVQPSKSTSAQITDACGMLEAYAQIDKRMAKINNNSGDWRLSEDAAFIEAMNQEMADTVFYGNTTIDPEKFVGLAPRYPTPSSDKTQSGYNMLDGAAVDGQTDCTSIYLVVWGERTVHGIYPKGSSAGLSVEDLGEVTLTDADGGMYQGLRSHYQWDCGLTVRDWRYVVRICNIDVSALVAATTATTLLELMTKAIERLPSLTMGRPVFYCNKVVSTMLRIQAMNKASSQLTLTDIAGYPVTTFGGIPVRRCDAISEAESLVSGNDFGTP